MTDVPQQRVPLLELSGISLSFAAVSALADVSFSVWDGEMLAIIGPNGAGKSSMLNVINGIYHPQHGSIRFAGELRRRMDPGQGARRGIARTFQSLALFRGMTVLENVLTGMNLKANASLLEHALRLPRARREEARQRQQSEQVLELVGIRAERDALVGELPYGLQKRVELARALAAEPRLILLDEPMAGMNFHEKVELSRLLVDLNERRGLTVVLIEHDMGVVMGISDRVIVLDNGRKIADGTPDSVRNDARVIDAYLGVAHTEVA